LNAQQTEKGIIAVMIFRFPDVWPLWLERGGGIHWFANSDLRRIYQAIETVANKGFSVDLITVNDELGKDKDNRVDYGALEDLVDEHGHGGLYNLDSWIEIQRDIVTRRHVTRTIGQATADLEDRPDIDLQSFVGTTIDELGRDPAKPPQQILDQEAIINRAIDCAKNPTARIGMPWPIDEFNRSGQLSQPPLTDEYIMLLAPPSVGKTALAIHWALIAARPMMGINVNSNNGRYYNTPGQEQRPINIYNLESGGPSSAQKIYTRILANQTGIDMTCPSSVNQNEETLREFKMPKNLNVIYHCRDLPQIQAHAQSTGAGMIFIDNFKHIEGAGERESELTKRYLERSINIDRVRKNLGIPVVCLHHTNSDGKAMWATGVFQDVDINIGLSRDQEGSASPIIFNMNKNRDGRPGLCHLNFLTHCQQFSLQV